MKSPYLYVEARGWFEDDATIDGYPMVMTDDPISFDSVRVEAVSEDDAYQLGAALMDTKNIEDPANRVHATGELLNDYVVKL